jgi:hypothetical protein
MSRDYTYLAVHEPSSNASPAEVEQAKAFKQAAISAGFTEPRYSVRDKNKRIQGIVRSLSYSKVITPQTSAKEIENLVEPLLKRSDVVIYTKPFSNSDKLFDPTTPTVFHPGHVVVPKQEINWNSLYNAFSKMSLGDDNNSHNNNNNNNTNMLGGRRIHKRKTYRRKMRKGTYKRRRN